jgi:hypothetical protein
LPRRFCSALTSSTWRISARGGRPRQQASRSSGCASWRHRAAPPPVVADVRMSSMSGLAAVLGRRGALDRLGPKGPPSSACDFCARGRCSCRA